MEDVDTDEGPVITSAQGPQGEKAAPTYRIPRRELGAVEIPAVVKNVDRAIKAFGRVTSLAHVCRTLSLTLDLPR
jgi:general transcription factor 3C polypeptide 5 (transcription factor C subunit 1)